MLQIYADGQPLYYPLHETMTVTAPRLTLERGKAGSFRFGLPPTHDFFDSLKKLKTTITVEFDGVELFRGRVLSEEKDFYNIRTVYCEGDLAYLVDSVQKGEKYTGTTHALFRKIIAAHNARIEKEKQFEVGEIEVEDREIVLSGQSSQATDVDSDSFDYKQIAINSITNQWKTSYDYVETCLIEPCGGYLRTRRENGKTYLDWMDDTGTNTEQKIEFGINLLELTETVSAEELFTVLIPLGDDNLTIESVNNGSDELVDETMEAIYGRIVKTHVFDNVNQPSTLLENGQRFLANHANVPATVTVRAVDMHLLDSQIPLIKIGDSVMVDSLPHNITRSLNCTKIEYDFDHMGNCTFTFGTIQQSLTERYRKDKSQSEEKAASGGASGGGAAGSAAVEAAKQISDKFYDAWINVDEETGHIDLGTLYKEYKNAKAVLENSCGINIDAPDGNINIYDLKTKYDDQEKEILKQAARIELINDDTHAQIELVASRVNYVEGVESGHYASIVLRVDDLESSIELKADKVTLDAMNINLNAHTSRIQGLEDGSKESKVDIATLYETTNETKERLTANETKITSLSNATEAKITSLVSRTTGTETKIASIEQRVTDTESEIELKADKVTLNSKVTTINSKITTIAGKLEAAEANIGSLQADMANIDTLISNKITASRADLSYLKTKGLTVDNLYANTYVSSPAIRMGGATVATQTWVKTQLADYAKSDHTHGWSDITGKPTSFAPTKHRHSFSFTKSLANGHTHKVKINGVTYTSQGVSTNVTHSIDVNGYTGYAGS